MAILSHMENKTQHPVEDLSLHVSSNKASAVWQEKPLVLIGLMGAGKSTVGRKLAKSLDWPFSDSDQEIELAAGCSISDMFTIHGEAVFRDLEQRVIARLLSQELMVLATGGGAWMQPSVRQVIQEKAVSIWLKADIDVLLERVSRRSHRPLLEHGDKRSILLQLMAERYPQYEKADIIVDSDASSQEVVVKRIQDALKQFRMKTPASGL